MSSQKYENQSLTLKQIHEQTKKAVQICLDQVSERNPTSKEFLLDRASGAIFAFKMIATATHNYTQVDLLAEDLENMIKTYKSTLKTSE